MGSQIVSTDKTGRLHIADIPLGKCHSRSQNLILAGQNLQTYHFLFPRLLKNFLRFLKFLTKYKPFLQLFLASFTVKTAQKIFEFQFLEHLISFGSIKILHPRVFKHKGDRTFRVDGRQSFAQLRQIIVIFQRFSGLVRLDFLHMFISIFHGSKRQEDLRGSLFSHSRYTWNVICGISHQGFQINDLRRCQLILVNHFLRVIILDDCLSLRRLRYPDQNMICGKLKQIPVSGQDGHIHPLLLSLPAQGSQKVICLISFHGHYWNTHSLKHLFHHRNLFPQLLGHCLSRTFVFLVHFVTEGRRVKIKGHSQILWLLLV